MSIPLGTAIEIMMGAVHSILDRPTSRASVIAQTRRQLTRAAEARAKPSGLGWKKRLTASCIMVTSLHFTETCCFQTPDLLERLDFHESQSCSMLLTVGREAAQWTQPPSYRADSAKSATEAGSAGVIALYQPTSDHLNACAFHVPLD